MAQYDFAVVGKGMMGTAAARHLSSVAGRVALIGPDEPVDPKRHDGVYGSHYDEGRITRTIDPDPVWAGLAHASIARYRAIERQSGRPFYTEAGCLIAGGNVGNGQKYVEACAGMAGRFGLDTDNLDGRDLAEVFPFFDFGSDAIGLWEKTGAGHVSPRALVAAQTECARQNGADVIARAVKAVRHRSDHAEIELFGGDRITASKVLVAAGGFSIQPGLLPDPVDLFVECRTVALFDVPDRQAQAMKRMPSMIFEEEQWDLGVYLLPPIRYPDGRTWIKIGGDANEPHLTSVEEIKAWFKTDGTPAAIEFLITQMRRFVPDVNTANMKSLACVTSQTRTGHPHVGWSDSRHIGVLTGGCGSSAKSSDEIGRLGASLLLHGSLAGQGYDCDFEPRFR